MDIIELDYNEDYRNAMNVVLWAHANPRNQYDGD